MLHTPVVFRDFCTNHFWKIQFKPMSASNAGKLQESEVLFFLHQSIFVPLQMFSCCVGLQNETLTFQGTTEKET